MNNQKGLTIVELLAAIVIISFVSIFATSILMNSLKTYANINSDTFLRDEADLIMANLIKELYTSKDSEINFIEDVTNNNYYITPKDSTTPKTGFKDNQILINGNVLPVNDSQINIIWADTNIELFEGANRNQSYNITLTLKTKNKNNKKTFKSEVRTINDLEIED